MNPNLSRLQPYSFEKLAALLSDVTPPAELAPIALSIGEPRHPPPGFVRDVLDANLQGLGRYPAVRGSDELGQAIAAWATRRFRLGRAGLDPQRQLLPVNGSREALFAFAQCVIDNTLSERPLMLMPNPCYQIYEGAALLAGADPYYLHSLAENDYLPDLDAVPEDVWRRCQLIYLCSPDNPTGKVLPKALWQNLLDKADRYEFVVASDECYSEIYFGEPPPGLLQICAELGRDDYRRCLVFNSLSKRSNVPGLRSGFVAGDSELLRPFLSYRTYHGGAMAPPTQALSAAIWQDEAHVVDNRALYREKLDRVLEVLHPVLDIQRPEAGFFLWASLPQALLDKGMGDTRFTRELLARQHVKVLPGSYLANEFQGVNPGVNRIRLALVAPLDECLTAARRIAAFISS